VPVGRRVLAGDEVVEAHAHGVGDPAQEDDRDVALPALELGDVALREAGRLGQELARESAKGAGVPDTPAEFRQEERFLFCSAGHAVDRLPNGLAGHEPAQRLVLD